MWFKSQAVWLAEMEGELLAYPHGAHDDIIDALAYIEQMATVPFGGRYEEDIGEWNPIAGRM